MKIVSEFKLRDKIARKMNKKQYRAVRRWLRIARARVNSELKKIDLRSKVMKYCTSGECVSKTLHREETADGKIKAKCYACGKKFTFLEKDFNAGKVRCPACNEEDYEIGFS